MSTTRRVVNFKDINPSIDSVYSRFLFPSIKVSLTNQYKLKHVLMWCCNSFTERNPLTHSTTTRFSFIVIWSFHVPIMYRNHHLTLITISKGVVIGL